MTEGPGIATTARVLDSCHPQGRELTAKYVLAMYQFEAAPASYINKTAEKLGNLVVTFLRTLERYARVASRRSAVPDVAAGHRRSPLGVFLPDGPRDDTSRIRDESASVFEFRAECRTGRLS
jgi:hypothetical protein